MAEVSNKQVIFKDYVSGFPTDADMYMTTSTMSLKVPEGSQAVLVKNLYLSCDPYMRARMTYTHTSYIGSFKPGSVSYRRLVILLSCSPVLNGFGVAKVLTLGIPTSAKVTSLGFTGWEEYTLITSTETLFKIPTTDVPLSYYIGILGKYAGFFRFALRKFFGYKHNLDTSNGMPGMTAYAGFYEICTPKKGNMSMFHLHQEQWVSLLAVAKLLGCYVVGSAGTKEKVDLLKDKFGFDDAFNYKEEPDLASCLKSAPQDEIPWPHSRLWDDFTVQYGEAWGLCNLISIIIKQVKIQGFLVRSYYHLYPKYMEMVLPHIKEGKIVYVEDTVEGLENAPQALIGLFSGANVGKQVVVVSWG
ncbi:2-alkenal reductase (NADP(+)-dependent) [Vitis vinifera]|uniref:2-alkenal reductase (NADP(+)-dependent) n=1 Tax=Vitis vinifera TaxID=29760 RepID=A0A438CAP0_VITVI|nr:2-alkenal reductase (NADP(+)-dependent) [Vitis vinifera]